jgi:hypothetical protein
MRLQGRKPAFMRSLDVAAEESSEKGKMLLFRGSLFAEESLFSLI